MEIKWKDRSKLYKNLKLGDYLVINFKTLSKSKMLRLLSKLYEFYPLISTTPAAFTVGCLEDCYEKGQKNIFWVPGKLVSSTFDKK